MKKLILGALLLWISAFSFAQEKINLITGPDEQYFIKANSFINGLRDKDNLEYSGMTVVMKSKGESDVEVVYKVQARACSTAWISLFITNSEGVIDNFMMVNLEATPEKIGDLIGIKLCELHNNFKQNPAQYKNRFEAVTKLANEAPDNKWIKLITTDSGEFSTMDSSFQTEDGEVSLLTRGKYITQSKELASYDYRKVYADPKQCKSPELSITIKSLNGKNVSVKDVKLSGVPGDNQETLQLLAKKICSFAGYKF